jgi:Tfp pilus assembly protein PilF
MDNKNKLGKSRILRTLMLTVIFLSVLNFNKLYSQSNDGELELAYSYLNSGQTELASEIFERHIADNPGDTKIYLQLAYIHFLNKDYDKAYNYFEYVKNNSLDISEVDRAKLELENIDNMKMDSELNKAYDFLNNGQEDKAIIIFEEYIKNNPADTKIHMQLGYIYYNKSEYKKSLEYFQYVADNSRNESDVTKAKKEISNINQMLGKTETKSETDTDIDLNKAYSLLNEGKINEAKKIFKAYAKAHPEDTKIHMQLAYLYDSQKKYKTSLKYFQYVEMNSKDYNEIDESRIAIYHLTHMIPYLSKTSFDLYFHNFYDTYQENYISNLVGHLNYRVAKGLYTGLYTEIYMDNRSKPDNIFNDRFVEVGGFWKYLPIDILVFELRAGYVREIDFKKNSFNFKPMVSFGYRFGSPGFYSGRKTSKKDFIFMDLYTSGLYDYKFRNVFGQLALRETFRYLTGGYSYLEFYLGQFVQGDSKQLNYNNYAEAIAGIGFKPNFISFPVIFVEATNKFYFLKDREDTFQIKAGFQLIFNTSL